MLAQTLFEVVGRRCLTLAKEGGVLGEKAQVL
jgi:hypothetical protein